MVKKGVKEMKMIKSKNNIRYVITIVNPDESTLTVGDHEAIWGVKAKNKNIVISEVKD